MKDLFRVGEIAELFDINKKTLRYYDEIDLFKPNYIDEKNKYRYYTINQLEKLNTIMYLKALDIPLSAIKSYFENLSIENTLELFENQEKVIQEKIDNLQYIKTKLQNRIEKINSSINRNNLNKIIEANIEQREIIILKETIKSNTDLELSIRKLENTAKNNASIFLGEVGVCLSKEKLISNIFDEYDSTFIFVDQSKEYNKKITKTLPKGKYVCIKFNGLHEDSKTYYEQLLNYIKENNYDVLEDPIEITLIDSGLTNNTEEFTTEIQILIQKH